MTTRRWLFVALCLAPNAWLACSSDAPPTSSQSVETDSGSDSSIDAGHDATGSDANPGDATRGDSGADAAIDSGSDGGTFTGPPPPEAGCDPNALWEAGTLLGVSTSDADDLDSVTPDELTIAWTTGPANAKAIFYADRASTSDAFGSPQNLEDSAMVDAGAYTSDRVALSPDGLRLVVVNADGSGFSELTRASRMGAGSTFATPTIGGFTNIDGATPVGASVGDPVVGASDTSFYFSVYGVGSTTTIYRSLRLTTADPWDEGAPLDVAAGLLAEGSLRRRPTGISSDGRTLFFYDQVSSMERAAWINESSGAYDTFVDLGAHMWAAPSATCTTLYFSSAGASSLDLFSAVR